MVSRNQPVMSRRYSPALWRIMRLIPLVSSLLNNNNASLYVCGDLWMRGHFYIFSFFCAYLCGFVDRSLSCLGLVLLVPISLLGHMSVSYGSHRCEKECSNGSQESLGFPITMHPLYESCIYLFSTLPHSFSHLILISLFLS